MGFITRRCPVVERMRKANGQRIEIRVEHLLIKSSRFKVHKGIITRHAGGHQLPIVRIDIASTGIDPAIGAFLRLSQCQPFIFFYKSRLASLEHDHTRQAQQADHNNGIAHQNPFA